MPSTDRSRREVVAAVGGALAASLAGCSGDDPPEDTPTAGRPTDAVTDPAAVSVRRDTPSPFVDAGEGSREPQVLVDRADVEALVFRAEPPGTDDMRAFLDATDFGTAAVALHQRDIEECYRLRVEHVVARERAVKVDLCRSLRPADVACEVEARDEVVTAIRLPRAYETAPNRRSIAYASRCPERTTGEGSTTAGEEG